MTKFHINKNGVPAPCKAKTGNCPLGGDDTHFKTKEDAQAHADKLNESQHSLLPSVGQKPRREKNLREKLQIEMNEYKGRKVKVDYDGKTHEGKVKEVYFGNKPGFIIEDGKDFKHIKLDRITSLEALGKKIEMGAVLDRAISKKPFYKVRYDGEGKMIPKEFVPESYKILDDWGNVYVDKETAQIAADKEQLINEQRQKIKTELSEFTKANFNRKPVMSEEKLLESKEDLAEVESRINEALKDNPNFDGVRFEADGKRRIRVIGFNKQVKGYSYGRDQELNYDLTNKDEVVENFVGMWKQNDNEESFKRFIQSGEDYGWD